MLLAEDLYALPSSLQKVEEAVVAIEARCDCAFRESGFRTLEF